MILYRAYWWDGLSSGSKSHGPLGVARAFQRSGPMGSRHNLPGITGVLYTSLSPVSAIAEVIKNFNGQRMVNRDLQLRDTRLFRALSRLEYDGPALIDLSDPAEVVVRSWTMAKVVSTDRVATQAIAATLHGEGRAGFLWPSAIRTDWKNASLFEGRFEARLVEIGNPERIQVNDPEFQEAASVLGIRTKD